MTKLRWWQKGCIILGAVVLASFAFNSGLPVSGVVIMLVAYHLIYGKKE